MNLIDDYCFKILKKLGISSESTFTDLRVCIKNKKTRSDKLKFLLAKKLILNINRIYKLTEKGKLVLKFLNKAVDVLDREEFHENLDRVPYLFRDYIYNFLNMLKDNFKEKLLSLILFGSVARGKWTNESDIDLLLILANDSMEYRQLNKKLTIITFDFYENNDLRDEKGNSIYGSIQIIPLILKDLSIFRTLYYDIAMDGIIIFDRKEISLKFIENIKQRIKKKGLKRVYISDNDFYWKRKKIKFGEIFEL